MLVYASVLLLTTSLAFPTLDLDLNVYRNDSIRPRQSTNSCVPAEPSSSLTTRLNQLLQSGGPGYTLNLCPNTLYFITNTITFSAPDQVITTLGNPTDDSRATLVVNGPRTADGTGHTVAVNGQCADCDRCKLSHIQVSNPVSVQISSSLSVSVVHPHPFRIPNLPTRICRMELSSGSGNSAPFRTSLFICLYPSVGEDGSTFNRC